MKKIKNAIKTLLTKNIGVKLLALVLAAITVIFINL